MYSCYSTGTLAEQAAERKWPSNCPTKAFREELKDGMSAYQCEPLRTLAISSYECNILGECQWTRVEEVMEFTRLCGFSHLGIAYCCDMREEARVLGRALRANGFEVTAVPCSVGYPCWDSVGIDHPATVCNVVGQAIILNRAQTDLNITLGQCVGDDAIFFMESEAPVTALVCKDKVTGHNPVAAIYGAHKYFKERLASHPRNRQE